MNVFVGRQPILDVNEKILGYELLHRDSEKNVFPNMDPDKATIDLLINTFISIGTEEVVGKHLSFINFTENLLAQDIFDGLDPEYIVIEILENVAITPVLLEKLKDLKEKGFRLALDDFVLQEQYQIHSGLFKLIDYIKVDFINTTPEERASIELFIRRYTHIELLAEKVETAGDFQRAKRAGYTLFQGYFFAEPEIVKGFGIPPKPVLYLQILDLLNAEDPNIEEIATLIKHDVSLSYRLLRAINSPGVGMMRKISSIKQAIILLGLNEMKKWMQVLALREFANEHPSGRIQVLIDFSLTRAKICEFIAKETGKLNSDEYFLAGLFSLMDVIMKREWREILTLIPLTDQVANTLIGEETEISPFVELAEAIERFDTEKLDRLAKELNIELETLSIYSQKANLWGRAFL